MQGANSSGNNPLSDLGPGSFDLQGRPVRGDNKQLAASKNVGQTGKLANNATGNLPRGKKLEYLGSIKVKDLKGKGQGYLKGAKNGKVECNLQKIDF